MRLDPCEVCRLAYATFVKSAPSTAVAAAETEVVQSAEFGIEAEAATAAVWCCVYYPDLVAEYMVAAADTHSAAPNPAEVVAVALAAAADQVVADHCYLDT